MKTEINAGYGWIICAHDDPDRTEVLLSTGQWHSCLVGEGDKDYAYRKRPLAPDGRKFSDPACEWEIVPEGDAVLADDCHMAVPSNSHWLKVICTSGHAGKYGREASCYARRRTAPAATPATPDPWIRFADRKPVEGDYPIVCMTRHKNTNAFDKPPSDAWHEIWHSWRSIAPLPAVLSDEEIAYDKMRETKDPEQMTALRLFSEGYAAGKESR